MLIGRAGSSSAKAGLKNKLRVSSVRIEVKVEVEVATEELTNLKSKSKVQVQTEHWVFTKIRYSNHPASQLQESFKEAKYSNISKTKVVSKY